MDDFEDRVRRALQHPSTSAEATDVLADVHRSVRNRQQRRVAVGAAGVLAVLTATGLLAAPSTGPDRSGDTATGPTASAGATSTPATPDAGSTAGPVGFDATPDGLVWTLDLATCAHQPCSVLTRSDRAGTQNRLHVFALDPGTPAAADLPPVESVTATADGQDLWVAGQAFWSSHDGGTTWDEQRLPVGEVPQQIDVEVVGDDVFALQTSPSRLWRSAVAADDWTEVPLPGDVERAAALTALGNNLVVTASSADRRVVLSLNASGGGWHQAEAPCQDEVAAIRSTGTILIAPCPGDGTFFDAPLVVWRSWDGETWKPFVGVTPASYLDTVFPIDDDSVFVVTGAGDGLIVTEDGQEQVDLPLGRNDTALDGQFVDADRGYLLVASPQRLLATADGGRTWTLAY